MADNRPALGSPVMVNLHPQDSPMGLADALALVTGHTDDGRVHLKVMPVGTGDFSIEGAPYVATRREATQLRVDDDLLYVCWHADDESSDDDVKPTPPPAPEPAMPATPPKPAPPKAAPRKAARSGRR